MRQQVSYPISEGTETSKLGPEAREFLTHRTATLKQQYRAYGWLDWAAVVLPCIAWLRKYNFRRNLLVRLLLHMLRAVAVPCLCAHPLHSLMLLCTVHTDCAKMRCNTSSSGSYRSVHRSTSLPDCPSAPWWSRRACHTPGSQACPR